MTLTPKEGLAASEAEALVKRLVVALRGKYGDELARSTEAGIRTRMTWKANNEVSVELDWLHAARTHRLNVRYSRQLRVDAGAL